jgi:putative transposase
MAGNWSEVFLHVVWTTHSRHPLITPPIERRLHRYISTICTNNNCIVLAINSMPDHVHLAIALPTDISIGDLVHAVKGSSSTFAREKLTPGEFFGWRDGYSVFSFRRSDAETVVAYIRNQKRHHADGTLWPNAERLDPE